MSDYDGIRVCWRCGQYETTNPSGVCWRCREQEIIDSDDILDNSGLWFDPDDEIEPDDTDAPLYDTDERNS